MASVSADMTTVGGWTLESILKDRLWSRSTYGVSTVGALRQAGYSLLPTYAAPHYDIVLPALTEARAATLLALFSPPPGESLSEKEAIVSQKSSARVDIPCDVQQVDETGYVWAFLDEAANPERIVERAIVVSGDEVDPVLARVVRLTPRPSGVKVHLELVPADTTNDLAASSTERRSSARPAAGARRRPVTAGRPTARRSAAGRFVVKRGSTGTFRFSLVAANGQIIATSEPYSSKASAMNAIRAVRRLAPDAEVEDQTTAKAKVNSDPRTKRVRDRPAARAPS